MSRNIRTFNDLGGGNDSHSDNDSEGEDSRPQDFYVGSGQQVQGPPGGRARRPNEVFNQVLDSARANGADALTADQLAAEQPGDVLRVNMYIWTNGFSIDNGPLRAIDEPSSREFLRAIMAGKVPAEIEQLHQGKKIDFHIEKKGCEYEPPKMKAFDGAGVRLGNVVPSVVGESSSSSQAPVVPVPSADEAVKNLENAKKELALDQTQPTTNLQIRLLNNQRLVGTFNQSHTVSAVRNYICTAHPELLYQPFVIATTYPRKDIDDETQTLKDANLLNAALALREA
ncbi:unnamed protein product [Caenorhabditis angaria]|uniref:NSFL1 cofactor p47 n=1 Tax=Caenorhabditis angaria TaxID=860376 RepID=A0A9P1IU78_9PELO|nr:unnamed protein product [Caenorhabditis angaria]